MQEPVLYLIIPCYNEEKVVLTTAEKVTEKLNGFIESGFVSAQSRILFVDDGSTDQTWSLLCSLYNANDKVVILRHNRNYGEQYAYLTGIRFAATYADCLITMDADLQDDINATDAMLEAFFNGKDVVYGVRKTRKQDHLFQKMTSKLFYWFMRLCGTKLVPEHSQYRLMSLKAAKKIIAHTELNVFLPALVPLFQVSESVVYYDRKPRAGGDSHYNVRSLSRMASNAILSYGIYLPGILLLGGILDAAIDIVAAFIFVFVSHSSIWRTVMIIYFIGAILLSILFYEAKKEMNRHLYAKKRLRKKDL